MFLRFLVERPPVGPLSASVFSLLPLVVYQMMDLLENPFLHQNGGGIFEDGKDVIMAFRCI